MQRNKSLQGLRAVACLLVFISHCNSLLNIRSGGIGAVGVEIFIVLSGFLSEVHFLESKSSIIDQTITYARRKISKFYWLHVLTLVLVMAQIGFGWILKAPNAEELKSFGLKAVPNLLLVQSWIPNKDYYLSLNGVSWYLSTALWLYICTPFLHSVIKKIQTAKVICCIIAAIFAMQVLIAVKLQESTYLHAVIYVHPMTRLLDYFVGMLLGWRYKNERIVCSRQFERIEVLVFLCLVAIVWIFPKIPEAFSYVVLSAPMSWLLIYILAFEKGSVSKLLSTKIPVFLGDISFEIFMIHRVILSYWEYVQWTLRKLFCYDINGIASTICVLLLSVFSAWLLHLPRGDAIKK